MPGVLPGAKVLSVLLSSKRSRRDAQRRGDRRKGCRSVNQIDEWIEESDSPPPNPTVKIFLNPTIVEYLGEVAKPVGVGPF
jgi:hypothetical protein